MLAVPRTWLDLPLVQVMDSDNAYIAVARGPHADRRCTINMENRNWLGYHELGYINTY